MSKISSNILIIVVTLTILFFVLCLFQFLIKCLIKRPFSPSIPHSRSFSEASDHPPSQLQQLFRQHDSGLDQALVDALPVFYYKEIVGLKEPFDCAVCLSEFSDNDELKLLEDCSHAFHIHCIETWLMSNSTCPLCRRPISSQTAKRSSISDFKESVSRNGAEVLQETAFFVRLGKFNGSNEGASSSSSVDARRCYSMGAFHYMVGEDRLQVILSDNRDVKKGESDEQVEKDGGKISVRSRGESLSVSKIWLWSKNVNLGVHVHHIHKNVALLFCLILKIVGVGYRCSNL